MPTKQWLPIEVGNEILDFKLLFVPFEDNILVKLLHCRLKIDTFL